MEHVITLKIIQPSFDWVTDKSKNLSSFGQITETNETKISDIKIKPK